MINNDFKKYAEIPPVPPQEDKPLEEIKPDVPAETSPNSAVAIQGFNALKNTSASETLQAMHNKAIMELASTNEKVKEKIGDNAEKVIDTELDTITAETEHKNTAAKFDMNKNACEVYGVENTCPLWQQKLMKFGANVWFIVYYIIASFTIVPVGIFMRMLSNIFKKTWVALLVGLLIYLFIVLGIPLIVTFTGKIP